MKTKFVKNSLLYRSSTRGIRTALPISSIALGSGKYATDQFPRLFNLSATVSVPTQIICLKIAAVHCQITRQGIFYLVAYIFPSLNFGPFIVLTLKQPPQQSCLIVAMDSGDCCLLHQGSSDVIQLAALNVFMTNSSFFSAGSMALEV